MTDGQSPYDPPRPPDSPADESRSWWKKKRAKLPTWAWIVIGVVVLGGVGGALSGGDDGDETAGAAQPSDTTATETTVESVQSTTPPTVETTIAETTTTAAPTTSEAPATTIDEALQQDMALLLVLGDLRDGDPDLVNAFVSDLEPTPLDRVDVVTAQLGEGTAVVVVAGTSGYGTDEYQIEAAVDTLTVLSTLWSDEMFAGGRNIRPSLDLTVDGRHFVVSFESMVAVLGRQMTPQQALGLA